MALTKLNIFPALPTSFSALPASVSFTASSTTSRGGYSGLTGRGSLLAFGGVFTASISTPPVPVATNLGSGIVGVSYSATISVQGGTGPFTFSIASGGLPAGLSLNTSTGVISGTPTFAATSTFSIGVVDANAATGTTSFSITVTSPTVTISLVEATLPPGTTGTAYSSGTITASGGTSPYTFAVISGSLPAGISLSSGGVISGTPTAAGTSTFTVRATDASSNTGSQSFTLTVADPVTSGGNFGMAF